MRTTPDADLAAASTYLPAASDRLDALAAEHAGPILAGIDALNRAVWLLGGLLGGVGLVALWFIVHL